MSETFRSSQMPSIEAKTFWHALSMRAIGVSIVTALGEDGPAGFLALSATHVTANPPSMLVSIDNRTHALQAVLHSRHFAINYLPSNEEALADSFGGRGSLKGVHRFEAGRWQKLSTGAPVLASAVGAIDCVLEQTFRFHDTTIVIGYVSAFHLSDTDDALIFHRGGYRNLLKP